MDDKSVQPNVSCNRGDVCIVHHNLLPTSAIVLLVAICYYICIIITDMEGSRFNYSYRSLIFWFNISVIGNIEQWWL